MTYALPSPSSRSMPSSWITRVLPDGTTPRCLWVLAAVGSGNRLHALRPAPARLHREASGGRTAQMHDVDPQHQPCLLPGVESLVLRAYARPRGSRCRAGSAAVSAGTPT